MQVKLTTKCGRTKPSHLPYTRTGTNHARKRYLKAKNISGVNTQPSYNVNHSPVPIPTGVRNARQVNQRVKPTILGHSYNTVQFPAYNHSKRNAKSKLISLSTSFRTRLI